MFVCCANEADSDVCLLKQGLNLAREIEGVIENRRQMGRAGLRISFLGFSMGGLVIRAALPHLAKYKRQFYNFITLSSPHLGCVYGSSFMINTGMKIIEKINTGAVCIR